MCNYFPHFCFQLFDIQSLGISSIVDVDLLHLYIVYLLYPRKRRPTTEYQPTPHFELNFSPRSNVYLNMRPCVAALKKRSSNGWFMRTELQIIKVRSISNLPHSCRTNLIPHFSTNERSCMASDCNHAH